MPGICSRACIGMGGMGGMGGMALDEGPRSVGGFALP